ncbi:hypothetical protein BLNAU_8099 [Blattamonas nauphoetae]|uniref:Uncharacterized protein n=1 Tax=Blattamonas nauphoetae TaxID=2049346 RepID=A0ABQ9Y011_9EUKA|nr:hypothetical protein BLNAU_8099 [Blattamonas nauphoetae]
MRKNTDITSHGRSQPERPQFTFESTTNRLLTPLQDIHFHFILSPSMYLPSLPPPSFKFRLHLRKMICSNLPLDTNTFRFGLRTIQAASQHCNTTLPFVYQGLYRPIIPLLRYWNANEYCYRALEHNPDGFVILANLGCSACLQLHQVERDVQSL